MTDNAKHTPGPPISQHQIELLARARSRIARSRVRHGDKIAYPDDMQLMLDLVAQIESLTSALEMNRRASDDGLFSAARQALNYIENTESELGITLYCGNDLRAAIAKWGAP